MNLIFEDNPYSYGCEDLKLGIKTPINYNFATYFEDVHNFSVKEGVRSYDFSIYITTEKESQQFVQNYHLRENPLNYGDLIKFNLIVDLFEYVVTKPYTNLLDDEYFPKEYKEIDYLRLFSDFHIDITEIHERALRRNSMIVPESRSITGDYYKGKEFLEFTKDTAHDWGGPFVEYDTVGCAVGSAVRTISTKKESGLYLCGNDDTSYTKWFDNDTDLMKELNYLRMMQPLNMRLDIYNRGYEFTN